MDDLKEKISELFNYRVFPELFELAGEEYSFDNPFVKDLVNLQSRIYYLDDYLESNWKIKYKKLGKRWDGVYDAMAFTGWSRKDIEKGLNYLKKYQTHELQLREERFPSRLDIEYFYFYKSCDVKILRNIIYDKYPKLQSVMKLSDWRIFDLVTEVNDDVADVQEDMDTINGNAYLIQSVTDGSRKTHDRFETFLLALKDRNSRASYLPMIKEKTESEITNTVALLDDADRSIKEGGGYDLLFNHLRL